MRYGANAHVDVAALSGAAFLPTMIPGGNLLLWLRADTGVTLSSASVSNNTTEAANNWTKTLCTRVDSQTDPAGGTSAIQITDTSDGAPSVHRIVGAWTNLQVGPGLFDVWLKAGTLSWVLISFGSGGPTIYLDLANAVTGTASGGTIARLLSGTAGGWQLWRCEATSNASTSMFVNLANANGGVSYQGDGTGTIFVGTGATYGPVLTQDRVSGWADQSGNGNNATQGTAGSQMLRQCFDGSGLWVPSSNDCRIGWPVAATKFHTYPAAMSTIFNGDGIPITTFALIQKIVAAGAAADVLRLTGATSARISQLRLTPTVFSGIRIDDGALLTKNAAFAGTSSLTLQSAIAVDDGTNERLYLNGVADANNPRDRDVGTQTFGTSAVTDVNGHVYREIIVYKTALSDANRKRVENGMRARWGLAPV